MTARSRTKRNGGRMATSGLRPFGQRRVAVSKHDAAPAATPLSIVSAMSRNPDGQKIKTARKSGCYCPSWIGQRGSYGVGTYRRMRFSVDTVFGMERLG